MGGLCGEGVGTFTRDQPEIASITCYQRRFVPVDVTQSFPLGITLDVSFKGQAGRPIVFSEYDLKFLGSRSPSDHSSSQTYIGYAHFSPSPDM